MGDVLEYRGGRRVKVPPTREQALRFSVAYWYLGIAVAVAGALCLWLSRVDPEGGRGGAIGCLMFIAWAVGVEIILAVLFCVRWWRFEEGGRRRLRNAAPLGAVALVVTCVMILIAYAVPFRLAFWWSRAAMERAVAVARADPAKGMGVHRVGLFSVKDLRVNGAAAGMEIDGAQSFDVGGFFEWSPGGPPASAASAIRVVPLGHDWNWVLM